MNSKYKNDLPDPNSPDIDEAERLEIIELMKNRDNFIREYKEKYGIELDPKRIKKNLGLRYLAKLCLNNLCKLAL